MISRTRRSHLELRHRRIPSTRRRCGLGQFVGEHQQLLGKVQDVEDGMSAFGSLGDHPSFVLLASASTVTVRPRDDVRVGHHPIRGDDEAGAIPSAHLLAGGGPPRILTTGAAIWTPPGCRPARIRRSAAWIGADGCRTSAGRRCSTTRTSLGHRTHPLRAYPSTSVITALEPRAAAASSADSARSVGTSSQAAKARPPVAEPPR